MQAEIKMTQLYCIYDPEGKALFEFISSTKENSWISLWEPSLHGKFDDFKDHYQGLGYACKPIQIANLEEERVLNLDDERLFY